MADIMSELGGLLNAGGGAAPSQASLGGLAGALLLNKGGVVPGDPAEGDSVPALLTPGEKVTPAPDDGTHEYAPDTCPGCASYASKYGHSDLVANLNTEQANLDAARYQSALARPAADTAADVTHPKVHNADQRRPRESITNAAVSPNVFLGRPRRRTTETRVRPSDEGD